jgi:hypothetical protein
LFLHESFGTGVTSAAGPIKNNGKELNLPMHMSHKSIDGRKKNKKHFSGNYASSEKQNQVN